MTQWGVVAGVGFGLLLLAGRPWLPALFGVEPHVRSLLLSSLVVVAALQIVAGPVFVLDGVLIGAGDMRFLAAAGVLTTVVFLPAAGAVRLAGGGLVALWLAIGVWMLARLATLLWRAHGQSWLVTGAVRR